MSHFITKCDKCGITITQCRCPDPNKTVNYQTCDSCKVKILEGEIKAVIEDMPQDCQIIVREGGGEENLAASLAVSVAKLRRKVG